MITAFQKNAFQNNAFQIDTGGSSAPVPAPGGGGGVRGRKPRRLGLYWPKLSKKKTKEDVLVQVLEQALEQAPVAELPQYIDVGFLAQSILQTHSYAALRQIDNYEQLLVLIKRELEELEDEEALIWLL